MNWKSCRQRPEKKGWYKVRFDRNSNSLFWRHYDPVPGRWTAVTKGSDSADTPISAVRNKRRIGSSVGSYLSTAEWLDEEPI